MMQANKSKELESNPIKHYHLPVTANRKVSVKTESANIAVILQIYWVPSNIKHIHLSVSRISESLVSSARTTSQ